MIAFQYAKPLRKLIRLTLTLVAAVVLTNVSHAAPTNLSDTFEQVNPAAVLQVRDDIRALPSGARLTIEILRQGERKTIEFVPTPDSQKLEQSRSIPRLTKAGVRP